MFIGKVFLFHHIWTKMKGIWDTKRRIWTPRCVWSVGEKSYMGEKIENSAVRNARTYIITDSITTGGPSIFI